MYLRHLVRQRRRRSHLRLQPPPDGNEQDCNAVSVDQAGECQPDPEPCKTSVEEVGNALTNVDSDNLRIVIKFVNEFGGKFSIDNETRLQHFLAQTAHESTSPVNGERFGAFEENLNYSTETLRKNWPSIFGGDNPKLNPTNYAGNPQKMAEFLYGFKKNIGNNQDGDGWKFRGRGVIQLTLISHKKKHQIPYLIGRQQIKTK